MIIAFEITLDCADAAALATFWKSAVGYVDHGRPGPGTAWLVDPRGIASHLCLIEVPEPKTGKNRMHIDLVVSGEGPPETKWRRITDEARRLSDAGASVVTTFSERWITMADPEGNEFDVC